MKAVILAAGRGTRLQPLTDNLPKAMVPIADKPMLQVILEQLKSVNVSEIIIIVHHLKEKIIEYFGDGQKFGLDISYVEQKEMKGTADAVAQAEPFINEKFLCIACDSLFETELLRNIISRENVDGVITCKEIGADFNKYGILQVENDLVLNIVEKPDDPPSNLANFSVYLFPPEIIAACQKVPVSSRGEYEVTDAIKALIDSGMKFGYEISKEIIDIGNKEQLKAAEWLVEKFEE